MSWGGGKDQLQSGWVHSGAPVPFQPHSTSGRENISSSNYNGPMYSYDGNNQPMRRVSREDAFIDFFGRPNKPSTQYYDDFQEENLDLPDAYHGRNMYLRELLVSSITKAGQWPVTELFPWKEQNDSMTISWDKWIFDDNLLTRVPEESVGRLLQMRKTSGSVGQVRKGIALLMEHGFYNTKMGRENFACHIKQIMFAISETACLDAIYQLMYWPLFEDKNDRFRTTANRDSRALDLLFQDELDMWGIVQKSENGFRIAEHSTQTRFQERNREKADMFVVPQGVLRYVQEAPTRNLYLFSGRKMGDKMSPTSLSGVTYKESRGFFVGANELLEDPMYRKQTIGGFAQVNDENLRDLPYEQYFTNALNLTLYQEDDDKFFMFNYSRDIRYGGLYHGWDTNEMPITKLGQEVLAEYKTWGDLYDKVQMKDKCAKKILTLDEAEQQKFLALDPRRNASTTSSETRSSGRKRSAEGGQGGRFGGRSRRGGDSMMDDESGDDGNGSKKVRVESDLLNVAGATSMHSVTSDVTKTVADIESIERVLKDLNDSLFKPIQEWFAKFKVWVVGVTDGDLSRTLRQLAVDYLNSAKVSLDGVNDGRATKQQSFDYLLKQLNTLKVETYTKVASSLDVALEPLSLSQFEHVFGLVDVDGSTVSNAHLEMTKDQYIQLQVALITNRRTILNTVVNPTTSTEYSQSEVEGFVKKLPSLTNPPNVFKYVTWHQYWINRLAKVDATKKADATSPLHDLFTKSIPMEKEVLAFNHELSTKPVAPMHVAGGTDLELPSYHHDRVVAIHAALRYILETRGCFSDFDAFEQAARSILSMYKRDKHGPPELMSKTLVELREEDRQRPSTPESEKSFAAGTTKAKKLVKELAVELAAVKRGALLQNPQVKADIEAVIAHEQTHSSSFTEAEARHLLFTADALFDAGDRDGPVFVYTFLKLYVAGEFGAKRKYEGLYDNKTEFSKVAGRLVLLIRLFVTHENNRNRVSVAAKEYHVKYPQLQTDRYEVSVDCELMLSQLQLKGKTNPLADVVEYIQKSAVKRKRDAKIALLAWAADAKHGDVKEVCKLAGKNLQAILESDEYMNLLGYTAGNKMDSWGVVIQYTYELLQYICNKCGDAQGKMKISVFDAINKIVNELKAQDKPAVARQVMLELGPAHMPRWDTDSGAKPGDCDNVKSTGRRSILTLEQVLDVIDHLPISSGLFWQFCILNDIPVALGCLLFRPHCEYIMGTMVAVKGHGKTGYTFHGHADFQLSDNPTIKMHFGHFTMYCKCVIMNPEYIVHARNIYCKQYVQGNGQLFWDARSRDDKDRYIHNELTKDIFVVVVPINYRQTSNRMDITGAWSSAIQASEETNALTRYPGCKAYSKYWQWTAVKNPAVISYKEKESAPRFNTIVFQEFQQAWNPATRQYDKTTINAGHWGPDVYVGCGKVRRGFGDYMQTAPYRASPSSMRVSGA